MYYNDCGYRDAYFETVLFEPIFILLYVVGLLVTGIPMKDKVNVAVLCTCSGPRFPPRLSRDRGQMSQATPKNPQIRAEPPVHWDTPSTSTTVFKCSLHNILLLEPICSYSRAAKLNIDH